MKSKVYKTCYLAGPMRGYRNDNFPAFDKAKELGKSLGYHIISPADLDRMDEGSLDLLTDKDRQRIYASRDCGVLIDECTHIAMLEGWEKSIGAKAEYHLAIWLGLEILDAITFEPLMDKYILTKEQEALNAR